MPGCLRSQRRQLGPGVADPPAEPHYMATFLGLPGAPYRRMRMSGDVSSRVFLRSKAHFAPSRAPCATILIAAIIVYLALSPYSELVSRLPFCHWGTVYIYGTTDL
jgi:hypothetical protein